MQYKTINNNDGETFDEQVTEALLNGWKLYGNPYSINSYEADENGGKELIYESYFCQALIKE